jgi:hypothetical protein
VSAHGSDSAAIFAATLIRQLSPGLAAWRARFQVAEALVDIVHAYLT